MSNKNNNDKQRASHTSSTSAFRPMFYIVCGIMLFWIIFATVALTSCGTPANQRSKQDSIWVRDTLIMRDTIRIRDTVFITKHDTVRIESNGDPHAPGQDQVKNLKAIIEHQNQMIRKLKK